MSLTGQNIVGFERVSTRQVARAAIDRKRLSR